MSSSYIAIDSLSSPLLQSNGICVVPDDVDFLYIMRRDTDFIVNKLFPDIAQKETVSALYDDYINQLAGVLMKHFSGYGQVTVHCLGSGFLEQTQYDMMKSDGKGVSVSLDPLLTGQHIIPLGVSRYYYPGGTQEKVIAARPGYIPLQEQIKALRDQGALTVYEDDVFSGSSIIGIEKQMKSVGATIGRVVPGIQVGDPAALQHTDITCQPIVKYVGLERSLSERIDLGDPRDFLLGADGLVVDFGQTKEPSGVASLGRVPYIMPFASPHARMGIAQQQEIGFSQDILALNEAFYENAAACGNKIVQVKDTDIYFQQALVQYDIPVTEDTRILDVIRYIKKNMDELNTKTIQLGNKAKGLMHD